MSVAVANILKPVAPEPDRELAELWRYAPTAKLARLDLAPLPVRAETLAVPAGAVVTRVLDATGLTQLTITVAPGAMLTLLETVHGTDRPLHLLTVVAEIAPGGTLRHTRLASLGDSDFQFTRTAVQVAGDGRYDYFACTGHGAQTRHQVEVALDGRGANATLAGCTVLAGDRLADHTLIVRHNAPATHSSQFFRSAAAGQSRGAFQGKIIVAKGADGTNAQQSHKALLLGARAEIDAKPELEIHADEVKCSHGASVGRLDEGALFYLRSRGLAEEEARALLTEAFLHEALERADWLPEAWRTMVEASLAA